MRLHRDWSQFVTAAGDYVNRADRPVVAHVYVHDGVVTLATQGVVVTLLVRDVLELAEQLRRGPEWFPGTTR